MNVLSIFPILILITSFANAAPNCEQLSSNQAFQKIEAFVNHSIGGEVCWNSYSYPISHSEITAVGYVFSYLPVCPSENKCDPGGLGDWSPYPGCQWFNFTVSCDGTEVTGKPYYGYN
jgi:hypothetical protein